MATEGASGVLPPPIRILATALHGSVEPKCELNMDNLSRPELLTLLSIMEGELEARDLVIEALRARRKEVFIQERYSHFDLSDPFLALQRDHESQAGARERRAVCANPISVLEAVMADCRKMQERMSAQLLAAEGRQKELELEKLQLQSLEQEQRKLSAQLKDERQKNKHIVMMLVRECKRLAARVVEESQRFDDLSARLEEEGQASARLQEELAAERSKAQKMEAGMEKQLSEMDTERERLRARLVREEARTTELTAESEGLRRRVELLQTPRLTDKPPSTPLRDTASVAVGTDAVICRTACCQTDPVAAEHSADAARNVPLAVPAKSSAGGYSALGLPKSQSAQRGLVLSYSGGLPQTENGSSGVDHQSGFVVAPSPHGFHSPSPTAALPAGVSPRVQAARYKFQAPPSEQDQNGSAIQSPPSRDVSPTSRDNFAAKQQARHTVTQVLSRFTSPPTAGGLRPGLPHSTSEGGSFPSRLGHPQIGLKSPTVGRIDRGTPPPIPPKKPGLSQTPSPPHPPIKATGESGRSPGAPSKPATPQLPPKPALELAGAGAICPIPALATSQVGACPPERQGHHQGAACSECPAVATAATHSSINPVCASSCRTPDTGSSLATASGWCPSIVPSLSGGGPVPLADGRLLLHQAATQGNVTLLSMLLTQDPTDDSPLDKDANSALYSAAQHGHTDCVRLLLTSGTPPDVPDENGFTPLHVAAAHGHSRCLEVLAGYGTDVNQAAVGGQTPLFLASAGGSPDSVKVLLDAGADRSGLTDDGWTTLHAAVSSGHRGVLELLLHHPAPGPAAPLNQANREGWTAAHIAASRGFKDCLEVLCSYSEQDIGKLDKCERTIHDVATDDCKDLLETLDFYKVLIRIQRGSGEQLLPALVAEDMPAIDGVTIGGITIHRLTGWADLTHSLTQTLSSHLELLCGGWGPETSTDTLSLGLSTDTLSLGLSTDSVSSVLIGDAVWFLGQELPQSPWDLIRKPQSQHITVRLKGLLESSLDELTYESLVPLQMLQNYTRLVEQYRTVIFHGLEGCCQEYIANLISLCIKHKQETVGVSCDIVKVRIVEDMSKEQLLETFINCGFLVPATEDVPVCCVLVRLEGLEQARSLSELLGDLCDGLENRESPISHAKEGHGPYHFQEGSFLIGSLSKPRLQGADLLLQQHFRWVQLRWDSEPLSGLLCRHLHRKLVHATRGRDLAPSDTLCRTVAWVCLVWQRLNSCLWRLGTPEALIGPQMFLSCPVDPEQPQAAVRWLSRLWKVAVVPRVQEAIVSRVTAKRSPAQHQVFSNRNPVPGQQAVVKAALRILVNNAILQGCLLPRTEMDKHLSGFLGGSFPLSAVGSQKGGGLKGQGGTAWRKASTSPRMKGSPFPTRSSREGSLSNTELHLCRVNPSALECVDGDPTSFSLNSEDDVDLMQELQTMCSSKISRCHSDGHASDPAPRPASNEKRASQPKSQLPIPGSKGPQRAGSKGPQRASSSSSSRVRPVQPSTYSRSPQDVWVLHRDWHQHDDRKQQRHDPSLR